MKQKKFVGFLLTLCMLLSMVQVSVFADNSIKVECYTLSTVDKRTKF